MGKNIFKNWIVKNLLSAILAVGLLIAGAIIFLNLYTRHGKELEVPDFYGMSIAEATAGAALNDMTVEVTDSIYVSGLKPGAVYRQIPKAGSAVKKGRKIRLTINAFMPKTVLMPNLEGLSMRQARAELSTIGLNTGKLIYEEDIATNNVLGQMHKGREIAPGSRIRTGSTIDLVLGLNPSDNATFIPDMLGMNARNAVELLLESSLNIGEIIYDNTVRTNEDSIKAVIYRQIPEPSEYSIPFGAEAIIYLTTDITKIPVRTEEGENDSTAILSGTVPGENALSDEEND